MEEFILHVSAIDDTFGAMFNVKVMEEYIPAKGNFY